MSNRKIMSNLSLMIDLPIKVILLSFFTLFAIIWFPRSVLSADNPSAMEKYYLTIEIGSKGVKPLIISPIKSDDGYIKYNIIDSKSANINFINSTPSIDSSIGDTVKAVEKIIEISQKDFKIKKIYLYMSSGVAALPHAPLLAKRVHDVTGFPVHPLSVEDEVRNAFTGAVEDEKRKNAVFIDIGSGNVKFAYREIPSDRNSLVTFELPFGTVTLSQIVGKELEKLIKKSDRDDLNGGGDISAFSAVNRQFINHNIRPMLRELIARNPGLQNKRDVYLAGGIVWATATLQKPNAMATARRYINLSHSDMKDLYMAVQMGGEEALDPVPEKLSQIPLDEAKKLLQDAEKIRGIFSRQQLLGGLELAMAIYEECGFKNRKDKVRFARDAVNGQIIGFFKDRLQDEINRPASSGRNAALDD